MTRVQRKPSTERTSRAPTGAFTAALKAAVTVTATLAAIGYIRVTTLQAMLGLPSRWVSVEEYVRSGATLLALTLQGLPAALLELGAQPNGPALVGSALVLYLASLGWCGARAPLRRRVKAALGPLTAELVSLWLGLALLALAVRQLVVGQAALRIQDLLVGEGAWSGAAPGPLLGLIRSGAQLEITWIYLAAIFAAAAAGHVVVSYLRYEVQRFRGRRLAEAARFIGLTAGGFLVLAVLCLPALFAAVAVTAPFPGVAIHREGSAGPAVEGLLLTLDDSWLALYDPSGGRLSILRTSEVQRLERLAAAPLFPLRRPGAP